MILGLKCKLCLNESALQNSHVIGDSVFKKIFRSNSGKAISLSTCEKNIKYSNDSWAEPLLCSKCEKYLNENFEQYSLATLRGKNIRVRKTGYGVIFSDVNLRKLNLYFISLLWRAANSRHDAYLDVFLDVETNEYLRRAIFLSYEIPLSKLSVKVSRLIDRTKNGFTLDILKNIVVSPFTKIETTDGKRIKTICFVFEGFFVEFLIPGLTSKFRNENGVIHKSKKLITIPFVNVLEINEIFDNMVINYGKHIEGRSDINHN